MPETRQPNVILICTDQWRGDCIGDHHCYAKSVSYEPSIRVPMLFYSPRSELIPGGVVDGEHLVELRDVMPTLLDAAGAAIPESGEGQSLLPLMRGESADWRDDLHGEHNVYHAGIGSMHYIATRDWKYVWHSGTGREQLFDLANDPDECVDLAMADDPPAELERLRARLVEELTGREEGFVADGKLIAGQPTTRVLSE